MDEFRSKADHAVESLAGRDDVALIHHNRCLTGAELAALVYRLAAALRAAGVSPGRLVAIHAENSPEVVAVRMATHLLGACAAVFPTHASDELLSFTAADVLVTSPRFARDGAYSLGPAPGRTDLLAIAATMPATPSHGNAAPDDLCFIVFSGGTTGTPKGSCHTYADHSALVGALREPGTRLLVVTPLAYLAQSLVDGALASGGQVILLDSPVPFDPAVVLTAIERHRVTNLFLVEPQLFALATHPDLSAYDISSLRRLLHLGAAAPAAARRTALNRLGPVLCHGYGSSETGLVAMLEPAEYTPDLLDTAGKLLPHRHIRFTNPDGTPATSGEPGDIAVAGPGVAVGYWRRPDLDSAIADGWLDTGDVGFLDADGYLHILGRRRDMIGGIFPAQIENLLYQRPEVLLASAFSDTDHFHAVVVPEPGVAVDPARLAADALAALGVPVTVTLADHIPLTEQGKPNPKVA
ncbi:AMP-binding protein [Nocardia sp. NBC_01499]|uniref:class I adenylate-forming enzyme family protein n=1 Tax=Nocardia sp. NBC_01499 TaxID=2903597 RepID=UPI0038708113